jgi:hypothetical protein
MSIRLVANTLDYVHGIPHGAKLVLICMADYADEKGKCWPSFQKLSERCDMSRRHVIRVVADLEELGFVRKAEERPYKPTIYALNIPSSDTHVTSQKEEVVTPTSLVTPETLVTPMSLGSDTHVTSSSDIAMSPNTPVNRQGTVRERKGVALPIPDDFEVTERMYGWAMDKGMGRRQVDADTEQFVDYHRGKDSRQVDWEATWRTWMRNTGKFGTVMASNKRHMDVA